jgi:hypothetical protein
MDKALIIANNHYEKQPLQGCINDAHNALKWLREREFENKNITIKTDATHVQMVAALNDFVRDVQPQDRLFFLYSGHGTQVPYEHETDGYSEVLVPIDFSENRYISDNDLKVLSRKLPAQCHCLALFDCCFSGGIRDLHSRSYLVDKSIVRQAKKESGVPFHGQVISACKEDETAKELLVDGKYYGAFSCWFFQEKNDRLDRMIKKVNKNLKNQTSQIICGGDRKPFEIKRSFWSRIFG